MSASELGLAALTLIFPVFFVGLWLFVTWIIGLASGWYGMMNRYPDNGEDAFQRFRGLTARMGGNTRLNGLLRLDVCPTGLRIGMPKIMMPFGRDILVPWQEIELSRSRVLFGGDTVIMRFGGRATGRLEIYAKVADQLAAASKGRWPPMPPLPAR